MSSSNNVYNFYYLEYDYQLHNNEADSHLLRETSISSKCYGTKYCLRKCVLTYAVYNTIESGAWTHSGSDLDWVGVKITP
ncbi:MAG: hypothetical protein ACI8PD_002012 [Nitrospinales bacterium]|jgi:hypothetical protein